MKGIRLTLTTIALSVVANLISPAVQRILGCRPFILLRYWYVFLIAVLISLLFNIIGILLDKDRSDLWRARFLRILLMFHSTTETEKAYIVNDINARVNLARRELHFVNSLLPKLVRVEWVDDELKKAETYDLKEGEFIVRVSSKNSQPRNIVDIIHATTKRTSLIGLEIVSIVVD